MTFPVTRLRRLRQNERLRALVRETRLTPEAFVYPLFVCPGEGVRKEVRSMPGVFNLSVDEAVKEARTTASLGVPAVILFGLPETKDEVATGAWAENGIVQQAARAIKREVPDLIIMGDVCLCEYMSHGHCGVVRTPQSPQSLGAAAKNSMAALAVKPQDKMKAIDALAAARACRRAGIRNSQRRYSGTAGPDRGFSGSCRSRHRCPIRHDGWPRSRYPQGAR